MSDRNLYVMTDRKKTIAEIRQALERYYESEEIDVDLANRIYRYCGQLLAEREALKAEAHATCGDCIILEERVKELESEREALQTENERMRKALEWYADKGAYNIPHIGCTSKVMIDKGERARQALSPQEGQE